jgi:hypothetical protein
LQHIVRVHSVTIAKHDLKLPRDEQAHPIGKVTLAPEYSAAANHLGLKERSQPLERIQSWWRLSPRRLAHTNSKSTFDRKEKEGKKERQSVS